MGWSGSNQVVERLCGWVGSGSNQVAEVVRVGGSGSD